MDQTTLFWFPGESKQLFNLYSYFYSFKRKLIISEKNKSKWCLDPLVHSWLYWVVRLNFSNTESRLGKKRSEWDVFAAVPVQVWRWSDPPGQVRYWQLIRLSLRWHVTLLSIHTDLRKPGKVPISSGNNYNSSPIKPNFKAPRAWIN